MFPPKNSSAVIAKRIAPMIPGTRIQPANSSGKHVNSRAADHRPVPAPNGGDASLNRRSRAGEHHTLANGEDQKPGCHEIVPWFLPAPPYYNRS